MEKDSSTLEDEKDCKRKILDSIKNFCKLIKGLEGFRNHKNVSFILEKIQRAIQSNCEINIDWEKDGSIINEIKDQKENTQFIRLKGLRGICLIRVGA